MALRRALDPLVSRVLAFGTRGLPEAEARQVQVATLGSLAALAVAPAFTLQAYLSGFGFLSPATLITFTVTPGCLSPYAALVWLGHVRTAKAAYALGMNAIVLVYFWAYGAGAGLYLYASALGLMPFFLFGSGERVQQILFVALPVPEFLFAIMVLDAPQLAIGITPEVLRQIWLLNFVSAFAIVVSVFAIVFTMARKAEDRLVSFSSAVAEYLDVALVDRLRDGVDVAPEIRYLTVFFSDLIGSTRLSFEMGKEQFGAMINEYVREMQRIIRAQGGYIEDVSGDGILGYIGNFASNGRERDAAAVVQISVEMRKRLAELLPRFREVYGLPRDLGVRIGVSSGEAVVGKTAGARAIYTANGEVVNLGAKLEKKVGEISASGGILISEATAALVGNGIAMTAHELDVEGRGVKAFLLASLLVAVVFAPWPAHAGAFSVREQSAVGAGMAFAGEGTSAMGLGGMFFNPAAVTQAAGVHAEFHVMGIWPQSTIEALPGTSPQLLALGNPKADIARDAVIGTLYASFELSDKLFFGLVLAPPYGLRTVAQEPTPSQNLALRASAKSFEANPIVGYRINDSLSVAFGVRVLSVEADYSRALVPFATTPNIATLEVSDDGVGWNIGATFTPNDAMEMAFGFRSKVDLSLDGDVMLPPVAPLPGTYAVNGRTTLPEQLHFGVRRHINDSFTVLGSVEYQNWSIVKTLPFAFTSGPATGAAATTLQFHYRDSAFLSIGGEYRANPSMTWRAGLGFETTAVPDSSRSTSLPSEDGLRFSGGMSRALSQRTMLDVAISYYMQDETPINVVPGHPDNGNLSYPPPLGQLSYVGEGKMDLWSLALSLRHEFGAKRER